jgi:DNA-binding MarR family transcriptional regulator
MTIATISQTTAAGRGLCVEEEAFVALMRTTDALVRATEGVLKGADVLPAQYNVLRILRGSPEGLPCSEIGKRMISRDPDMTRLLDRMEKRGFITRERGTEDRRLVFTKITQRGLEILAGLDEPVRAMHKKMLGHMGAKRLKELEELLSVAREKAESDD